MMPHHHEDEAARQRLLEQFLGKSRREWPQGRVGGDDDGELAFAIAADPKHGIIRIEFGKSVDWIGLDRESAERLRDMLTEKLLELRGIAK
jgi:hypothetical protein